MGSNGGITKYHFIFYAFGFCYLFRLSFLLGKAVAILTQTGSLVGINKYLFIFYAFGCLTLPFNLLFTFTLSRGRYRLPLLNFFFRFFLFSLVGVFASLMALGLPMPLFNLLPGFIFMLGLILIYRLRSRNNQPRRRQHRCQSAPINDLTQTYLPAHSQTVIFADQVEENGLMEQKLRWMTNIS